MSDLPLSPEKLQYFSWHKWGGVTVFMLVWFRLVWRFTHRPPAYPLKHDGRSAAAGTCRALGAVRPTVVIPLSGWLMSSAKGVQTVWFGVLPRDLPRDKALGRQLTQLHSALNLGLMCSI
jgi:cytochrome b561